LSLFTSPMNRATTFLNSPSLCLFSAPPQKYPGCCSLPTIDPILHTGDSMGKHNRLIGQPLSSAAFPALAPDSCSCLIHQARWPNKLGNYILSSQRDRLTDIINTVVVDRSSPKIKEETCYRRSLPTLVFISSRAFHNIHGFFQPISVEVANAAAIGETQR